MAISTYGTLKTAVADWLARTDLTARLPDFITLAEAEISTEFSIREFEAAILLDLPAGLEMLPVPAGFLAARTLTHVLSNRPYTLDELDQFGDLETLPYPLDDAIWAVGHPGQRRRIDVVSPFERMRHWQDGAAGLPRVVAHEGMNLAFAPVAASACKIRMLYSRRLTGFTADQETNDLLKAQPNLYLYGALKQAYLFIQDDEQAQKWAGLFSAAIEAKRTQDRRSKWSGAPLRLAASTRPV